MSRKRPYKLQIEKIFESIIFLSACFAIISVLMISFFILISGIPPLLKINPFSFFFGSEWAPTKNPPSFGILPFIVGTVFITLGSLVLAIPIGLASGIFLSELSSGWLTRMIRYITELLAAVPTVVYGFFGNIFIAPFIQTIFPHSHNVGYNALSAMIVLAIILLPLIINMTYLSLKSVSKHLKQASYALGANQWQTIHQVLLPSARSGIIAGIVLALGRAIGETIAVLMVAGGSPLMPTSIFSPMRTLTGAIAMDMGYASGDHRNILFSICALLFLIILLVGYLKGKVIQALSFEK